MSAHRRAESPLDTAETSFRLLTTGPGGLSLDCTTIAPGMPRGPVGLRDLRLLLTSRELTEQTRDAVWRQIIARARQSGSAWTVAAVGMAMPALRRIALSLTRDLPCGDPVDIDIAIMAGYLRALHRLDVRLPDVRMRLCAAARHAGEHTRRHITTQRRPTAEPPPPSRPWYHPDLVLIDAVSEGVLSEQDAELITLSWLEDIPLRRPVGTPRSWQAMPCPACPSASARSRALPDATTGTGLKGDRDTRPGSARISPNHPSVAARRNRQQPAAARHAPTTRRQTGCRSWQQPQARQHTGCRHRHGMPPARWIAVWALTLTVVAVVLVAVVATGASAASMAAAVPPDLNTVLANLRNWLIGLLAALATLMLTVGGLRYLIAGGDPGEVQKAKAALKASAFGYALAILAPLFVSVLQRIVGG
ncbi:hypothetical protein [Spongiactinospora sp. TRM90649]|uniref:hypothetical protein n=1 Tax=Spongiactinospora sp. TRM90649 TaxID=3031114 RepID=UPI0023F6D90F|nr:hypothetical protein [Spongiactinospora sp. TRM90649]MDF5754841.1 hypothetical protein [Spongiactinospora sp. TRM90649]